MGAVDMTLRLDNASGVDHMPTAKQQTKLFFGSVRD
jgi:hypothetical protein